MQRTEGLTPGQWRRCGGTVGHRAGRSIAHAAATDPSPFTRLSSRDQVSCQEDPHTRRLPIRVALPQNDCCPTKHRCPERPWRGQERSRQQIWPTGAARHFRSRFSPPPLRIRRRRTRSSTNRRTSRGSIPAREDGQAPGRRAIRRVPNSRTAHMEETTIGSEQAGHVDARSVVQSNSVRGERAHF